MKSECSNGLTRLFGVGGCKSRTVASYKQCQSYDVDEVADKNDEEN